jgi:hypothetical protein
MNRVGFWLLAVGVILAGLGWVYDEPRYTGLGLVPLVVLFVLATAFPDVIDYRHRSHAEPMPLVTSRIWTGTALVGVGLTLAALWHSTASGGTGIPLAIAAATLPVSIVLYSIINDERVVEWRHAKAAKRARRGQGAGA